ncbi:MAG: ribosome-associated translation inhibitor RaiA [Paludibacteraceae bacterium]|jgi:putative sigma-54 modulation protein|nr:ribosome-associated translation inhibitor RaiA [Paludibacteraceae bacterium]
MDIKIQPIHFKVTERLEEHINKKVSKLEKLNDQIISADVILKVVKPETSNNKNAEIKVRVPSAEFFAEKTADSFEEAVDTALMAIEKQITKSKEKSR